MAYINDYPGSYGAAIGDIYGSYYEFQYGPKTPKSEIRIHKTSTFTDDTVLTAAVAEYLQQKDKGLSAAYFLQKWARKYRHAGFGGMFRRWMFEDDPKPYHSYGNGSAMRVSPVAYYASSIEECQQLAEEVTIPTHDHPEGIKGAVVIATCIYMALHGSSKEEIGKYAAEHYDLNLDYQAMVDEWSHGEEICQVTVPQALWIFLHSDSFDDCLRLCLHIRWDADTLASIACPIAEAFYKEIPDDYLTEANKRLPDDIKAALQGIQKSV